MSDLAEQPTRVNDSVRNEKNTGLMMKDYIAPQQPLRLLAVSYGLAIVAMLIMHAAGVGGWMPLLAFWLGGAALAFLLPATGILRRPIRVPVQLAAASQGRPVRIRTALRT